MTGWCLEGHDLAASKLAAFRDKDRDFVRVLLTEGLVDRRTLSERLAGLQVDAARRAMLQEWLTASSARR
jgi:hypothetical protein